MLLTVTWRFGSPRCSKIHKPPPAAPLIGVACISCPSTSTSLYAPKFEPFPCLFGPFHFQTTFPCRKLPESFSIHPFYASFFSLTNRKCLGVPVVIRRDNSYAFHRVDIRADGRGVAVWFALPGTPPILAIGMYLPRVCGRHTDGGAGGESSSSGGREFSLIPKGYSGLVQQLLVGESHWWNYGESSGIMVELWGIMGNYGGIIGELSGNYRKLGGNCEAILGNCGEIINFAISILVLRIVVFCLSMAPCFHRHVRLSSSQQCSSCATLLPIQGTQRIHH